MEFDGDFESYEASRFLDQQRRLQRLDDDFFTDPDSGGISSAHEQQIREWSSFPHFRVTGRNICTETETAWQIVDMPARNPAQMQQQRQQQGQPQHQSLPPQPQPSSSSSLQEHNQQQQQQQQQQQRRLPAPGFNRHKRTASNTMGGNPPSGIVGETMQIVPVVIDSADQEEIITDDNYEEVFAIDNTPDPTVSASHSHSNSNSHSKPSGIPPVSPRAARRDQMLSVLFSQLWEAVAAEIQPTADLVRDGKLDLEDLIAADPELVVRRDKLRARRKKSAYDVFVFDDAADTETEHTMRIGTAAGASRPGLDSGSNAGARTGLTPSVSAATLPMAGSSSISSKPTGGAGGTGPGGKLGGSSTAGTGAPGGTAANNNSNNIRGRTDGKHNAVRAKSGGPNPDSELNQARLNQFLNNNPHPGAQYSFNNTNAYGQQSQQHQHGSSNSSSTNQQHHQQQQQQQQQKTAAGSTKKSSIAAADPADSGFLIKHFAPQKRIPLSQTAKKPPLPGTVGSSAAAAGATGTGSGSGTGTPAGPPAPFLLSRPGPVPAPAFGSSNATNTSQSPGLPRSTSKPSMRAPTMLAPLKSSPGGPAAAASSSRVQTAIPSSRSKTVNSRAIATPAHYGNISGGLNGATSGPSGRSTTGQQQLSATTTAAPGGLRKRSPANSVANPAGLPATRTASHGMI